MHAYRKMIAVTIGLLAFLWGEGKRTDFWLGQLPPDPRNATCL